MSSPFYVTKIAGHFVRCLRALGASQTELDTSRMVLGFYCLAGLDILNALDNATKPEDRAGWNAWIWGQQIESKWGSGFRPSPTNHVPDSTGNEYDSPHLIMTFSALISLAILRDDLSKLNRAGLKKFVKAMQRPDGSFAAYPGSTEADLRSTYCAFVICRLLNAWDVIDVPTAEEFILQCQTYEGGFGQSPHNEAHGGTTFCAVASLSLSSDAPTSSQHSNTTDASPRQWNNKNRSRAIRWLLQRQLGGFQGRTNKLEDACYSFWCGGALRVLEADGFVDGQANSEFLIDCQFRFGGIAKAPGEMPDPFHTYMSLAALSVYPPSPASPPGDYQGLPDNDPVRSTGLVPKAEEELKLKTLDVAINATTETSKWLLEHLTVTSETS